MTTLCRYEAEVTFEMRRTYSLRAETDFEAQDLAIRSFRDEFAEDYDSPPSASELDVIVVEVA